MEKINLPAILGILNDLEDRFDVDTWKIHGVHIWPIVRMAVRDGLSYHAINVQHHQKGTVEMIKEVLTGNLRYLKAAVQDRKKNAGSGRYDAVFLGDGVSYLKLAGTWYERFCDPAVELLQEQSIKTVRWDTYHHHYYPRYSPSVFIQPALDAIVIRDMLFNRQSPSFAQQASYDACAQYYGSLGLSFDFPGVKGIARRASIIHALAAHFKKKLQIAKPRMAFVVWYYGIYGYAFTLACRELNIPVADIQHGVQGDMHAAYGKWRKVPPEGYNILPDFFVVWGETEAKAIESWSKGPRHKPVMTGNLFLNKWLDGGSDLVRRHDAMVDNIHTSDRPMLLFTMSPRLDTVEVIGNIMEAIKQTQSQYHWLIRLHPNMLSEKDRIVNMLHQYGITEFEMDQATALPLYALLRKIRLHITFSSSATIEAEDFGVRSIIASDYGMELSRAQLESGCAVSVKKPAEIMTAITKMLQEPPFVSGKKKASADNFFNLFFQTNNSS